MMDVDATDEAEAEAKGEGAPPEKPAEAAEEAPTKDTLFKEHMKRWKAVKKAKTKQHRINSERFEERLKILLGSD